VALLIATRRGHVITEAGANPISQLAFNMANGFASVEALLALLRRPAKSLASLPALQMVAIFR